MTIEDRVQSLETELARMKRRARSTILLVGLIGCGACWIISEQPLFAPPANGAPTELVANRFVVADEKGNHRVLIGELAKDTFGIRFMEQNGTARLALSSMTGAALMAAFDGNGVTRTGFAVHDDGCFLSMKDKNGKTRLSFGVTNDNPSISLQDDAGVFAAGLALVPNWGPTLTFKDKKGTDRLSLKLHQSGPGLTLFDEKHTVRAMVGACEETSPDGKKTTYPESSLLLFGPDGKVLRALP